MALAIAYASEVHLFIRDLNQSPFNVGTRILLEVHLTSGQVADLNYRYGSPLRTRRELTDYYGLRRRPPLPRPPRAARAGAADDGPETLVEQADQDDGIFGEHLRSLPALIGGEPELCQAVREVSGRRQSFRPACRRSISTGCAPPASWPGPSERDARLRCQLYGALPRTAPAYRGTVRMTHSRKAARRHGFYVAGGTLRPGELCYVERDADRGGLRRPGAGRVLLRADLAPDGEELPHGPHRHAPPRRRRGRRRSRPDCLRPDVTPEQWYASLLNRVGQQLGLEEELESYWLAHARVPPIHRWMEALREVALTASEG